MPAPQVTFPLPGNNPTELQPLLDACSPAMFGLGRQTLHDESVRKALQLPADRLGFSLGTSLPSQDILGDVRDLMMPWVAGPIRAEPYALNVFSPDGKSQASPFITFACMLACCGGDQQCKVVVV
jgi:hypothetical protein